MKESRFTIDRFKHNEANFKFTTGFGSYGLLTVVLEPGAPSMSHTDTADAKHSKQEPQRHTNAEEYCHLTNLMTLSVGRRIEVSRDEEVIDRFATTKKRRKIIVE